MQDLVHQEYRQLAASHWWFMGRRKIFARLLDSWLASERVTNILDVGPGSGVNMPVLGPRAPVTVLDLDGVDFLDSTGLGFAMTEVNAVDFVCDVPQCCACFGVLACADVFAVRSVFREA